MFGATGSEENKGAGHYGAIITPSFAFGLDIACKNCLWHIEGDRMMWSVGAQMVQYNTQSQEMRFLPLADRGVRALVLAVASNFKYFAVAEKVPGLEYDQVSVYAFGTDKRVKVLPHDPAISRAESYRVEGLHFSENSKYLLVQYGTPDWTLVVWRWYNGKVLAAHRMESRPILTARFSPVDDLLLAVLTPTSVLQYRMDLDREVFTMLASPPSWDPFEHTAMCWLAGNMLAVVGAAGAVNVFQEATTRLTARVEPLPRAAEAAAAAAAAFAAATARSSDDAAATAAATAAAAATEHLLAVTARGRGFIAAGTSGTVYFFEPPSVEQKRAGVRDLYVLVRRLAVDLPPPPGASSSPGHRAVRSSGAGALGQGMSLPLPPGVDPMLSGARPLVLLSVSAADDELVAVSAYGDVAVANMQLVLLREEKPIADVVGPEVLDGEPFTRLLGGFLTGRVVGLAAAAAQSLLAAVSSEDRQLRVWNYDARRCVAAITLDDEPLGLDLHPGGQLLLLALPDKIKMLSIVLDALEPHFEVAMKRPSVVRFSTGGAMFAYVGRTNAVHIHATYHGQPQLAALKAHASLVLDLRFSVDDRMLISVGVGGAVYFWDLNTFSRVMDLELVDKQALYCSVAVYNSETGAAVVRASDGRMQQIYNGKVQYEVMCKGGQMAPACLLGADKVLLAADDSGGVVSHAWPSDLPPRPGFASVAPPPHTYPIHSFAGGGITRMALVASRGLLFTANGDGTIMMSNIALVLDGVLMESTFGAVHTRGRLAAATAAAANSRMGSAASQRLLNIGAAAAAAAGGGGGGGGVPQGAAAQMGAAAAAAGASSSSTSTSSVPYYITIPEERFLAIRERAIEVAQMVGHAKNDAEYQAFRAAQVLRDTITRLETDLEAARRALEDKDLAIVKLQESGRLHERQVVKELEGAHMSAAEDLEALYEKRLQVEVERVRAMAAARDDARYRGEEEVKRMRLAHERELQELRNHYEAQLAAMDSKMSEAADVRAEQDRFFNEYVKQAEEDFEDHSQRINKKVSVLTEAAESREQRLKADNNILKRTNLRLKADKTIDMKRMDKLTADNAALREQTEDLKLTIAKLKKELDERDAVNADNYVTIQQLRRKLQELEKHKYVLSYKAETYAQKLEPQLEEIAKLQDSLEGHGRELLNQAKRTQLLNRHVAEKDSALRTAMASLADFKRRCELQDAAITAFAQELYGAMQLPDDRSVHGKSARQKALDDLVRKYCLGDPRANANRNAASEAIAAAAAAETRVVLLQWRLDQETRTQRATQRLTLNQNSQLLRELQVAQQDNRALRDRVDAAFVALREMQHRYAMLERRAGIKSGSRAGDEDLLDGSGGGGGGGGEDVDTPERANAAAASGGGGGGGVASLSGRVPPSRPGTAVAATGRRTPLSAGGGLHRHSHHHPQVRPGTAGGTRTRPPSAGLGPYRSGGPAGGGVSGVARGAPLRAFAELLISERQRMQALAAQLESGAVAVEQQQRALLGLRDQLAAEAAAADGDGDGNTGGDGGGDGGFDGDGNGNGFGNGLVQSGRDSDGGEGDLGIMPSFGRFGASLQGGEGILDGGGGADAAGSTAATGGSASQGDGSSSSRRVTVASNGGGGGGGGGSPIFGGANTASYHAPGVRGLNLAGGGGGGFGSGGGGAPARSINNSSGRPLTASVPDPSASSPSPRRSPASPSNFIGLMNRASSNPSSSSSATATPNHAPTPTSISSTIAASGLRSSISSPATTARGPGVPGPAVARSSSPAGGSRLRPTSAGGVGLRAFTDEKVDRFLPPPACTQQDLPF